jgi:hypothetical protein
MPLDEFGREIPSAFGQQHHHRPPPYVEDAPTPRKRSQPPPSSSSSDIKTLMTPLDFNNNGGGTSPAAGPVTVSAAELERQRETARRLQQQYPCFAYVEKALQCEYLYKEEQHGEEEEEMRPPQVAFDDDGKDPSPSENEREGTTKSKDEEDIQRPSYEEYRQSYCLNYIRMFFNAHLDDSWFRRRYSSLCRYQDLLAERDRAGREAALLHQQVLLLNQQQGDTTAITDKGESNNNNNDDFRLTGSKQARGHLFAFQQPPTAGGEATVSSTENTMAILVSAIPSHLTDEQLLNALDVKSSKQQQQPSGSGAGAGHVPQQQLQLYHVPEKAPYRHRSVIVVGPKRILEPTIRDIRETASSASIPSRYNNNNNNSSRRGQPQQQQQNSLEFSFECSTDPYNRTGIDADGHGGATADGRRVPLHTVTVRVAPIAPPLHPTILSATLSTPARFAADLQVATQLAALLDQRQSIPEACNLRALLASLPQPQQHQSPAPGEEEANDNEGDAAPPLPTDVLEQRLDIAVAYLRRVHLRNFYHQPDISHSYAQMLTAPYYVRMKILDVMDLSADLLAKHLDDGLARAVDAVSDEAAHLEQEDTLRTEAAEIERDMAETEQQWIKDHSIAHLKGRARCSFHFCNKLFQDETFLKKHLHKKHVEYLHAEQAKCHDKSMMKAWDAARQRPVPDIVIDCGSKFGLVPVRLLEGSVPDVEDPEPSLWQEEEERLAAMQRRREEVRGKQQHQGHYDQQYRSPPQQQQQQAPPPPRQAFVDVDDMPEEKVELTFDTAVAAIPAKKTKKKKRKLL